MLCWAAETNSPIFNGQQPIVDRLVERCIDLDPQTNATFSCIGIETWVKHAESNGTIANLLEARNYSSATGGKKSVSDVLIKDVFENVDLIPSHLDLFSIDLDLAGATSREKKLKRAVGDIIEDYNLIVCDCPPNLTIPTQNALALCDNFLVPISPDYLSTIGVGLLLNRVEELASDLEHDLNFLGIVLSRVGRPAAHRDETTESIRDRFGNKVLNGELAERTKVKESAAQQTPIFELNDQMAISEFRNICGQIHRRIGL